MKAKLDGLGLFGSKYHPGHRNARLRHSIRMVRDALLGVVATIGVGGLLHTGGNTDAVLVSSGVLDSGRSPDRPGSVDTVRAGDQVFLRKLKVVVLDSPALALGVLGGGLGASGVSNLSLAYDATSRLVISWKQSAGRGRTHSGPVNENLLRGSRLVVEVEGTVVDVESGGLLLGTGTAGILGGETGEEAALGGIECRVLYRRGRVNGDDIESLGLSCRGSSGAGGQRSRNENVLELHDGGVEGVERGDVGLGFGEPER